MSKRAAKVCVGCSSAGVQTHLSNTLVSKCLTRTLTSIQNHEVLGGLSLPCACLYHHSWTLAGSLRKGYCLTVWCLSAFLKPNWTTIPKLQTHEPHSVWDLWCLMVCCMEQGLLLALSVLLRIPEIVGGRELWRSSSPPSPRKQGYLQVEWNNRREKETKERGGGRGTGRRETLRAHFYIYHGGNILRKEQDWREVINFLCNLGVKMEDLHSHGMKVWGSAEICSEDPVALEKKFYPLLVFIPALPTGIVEQRGPKSTVSGKVFPLLNVNAIILLSLIKLSGYFSLHNLDKKMTIPPRLRKKPLALFLIWCKSVVVMLPNL